MMDQVLDQLGRAGIAVSYDFVRLICSKFDANDPSHAMLRLSGDHCGPVISPSASLRDPGCVAEQIHRVEMLGCFE